MRLFVAVEVSPGGAGPPTAPEHLTLAFLGEVPESSVDPLRAALGPVAAAGAPYDLVLEGVGAFPSGDRPRVVWVGATTGAAETTALANSLRTALAAAGFPVDRERFVPHLTLFRVRSPDDRRRARALLDGESASPASRTVRVREVVLKQSTLTPRGAVHRTVATFPLGRPGATDA